MTRILTAATGIAFTVAAFTLGGCTSDPGVEPQHTDTRNLRYAEVEIPDGRTVVCIVYAEGYGGGVSCDWKDPK